jgi:uncharacterized protein (TIGR00369 family)
MRISSTVPARSTAGISTVAWTRGRIVEEMNVPHELLDERGAVVTGALGILADSALGQAVASSLEHPTWVATSHLHLALTNPLRPDHDRFVVTARVDSVGEGRAAAHGEIASPDGTCVARASLGSVLLPAAPLGIERSDDEVVTAGATPDAPLHTAPVDALLGLEVRDSGEHGTEACFRANPAMANSSGGVHGGFGFLIGARLLDLLAMHKRTAMRIADVRAVFLRPITADGGAVQAVATILHGGRRLLASEAEIYDHGSRRAVVVEATHVAG